MGEVELEVEVELVSFLVVEVVGSGEDEVGRDEGACPLAQDGAFGALEGKSSDVLVPLVAHVFLGDRKELIAAEHFFVAVLFSGLANGAREVPLHYF